MNPMKLLFTLFISLAGLFASPSSWADVFTVVCKGAEPPDDVIRIDTAKKTAYFVVNRFIGGQTRAAEVDDSTISIAFASNTKWLIDRSSGYLDVEDLSKGAWIRRCPECKPNVCQRTNGAI